ncbi:hypothetical protein [Puia sp.]|uniref:hypothetical protein n=1 Tax=Puia sp. TaxID=2045100 RepID=UPI0039C8D922
MPKGISLYVSDNNVYCHNSKCFVIQSTNKHFEIQSKLRKIFVFISCLPSMFNYPYGITIDKAGTVFVADKSNCRIRKLEFK